MYVDTTVSKESAASVFRDTFMRVDVVMLHRHAAMRVFIHISRRVKKKSKLKLEIPCSSNCRFPLKTGIRNVYIRQ